MIVSTPSRRVALREFTVDARCHRVVDRLAALLQRFVISAQFQVRLPQRLQFAGHGGHVCGERLDGIGRRVGIGPRHLRHAIEQHPVLLVTAAGSTQHQDQHQDNDRRKDRQEAILSGDQHGCYSDSSNGRADIRYTAVVSAASPAGNKRAC